MNLKETSNEIANFFNREYSNLVGFLRAKINDLSEMESEDVISDIILQIFSNIGITEHVQNLEAYIYRAVHNRAIDYLRKRKRLVSINQPTTKDGDQTLEDLLADPRLDIHNEVYAREIRTKLSRALEELDPKQRAIWVATEIDGYTFRELAELWNEPIGTLLARKHRTAEVLRKVLQEYRTESIG